MASAFNLTAQINLRGPTNLKPIVAQIKREIGSVSANVKVTLDNTSAKSIDNVTNRLQAMNSVLVQTKTHVSDLNNAFRTLSSSLTTIKSAGNATSNAIAKTSQSVRQTSQNIKVARTEMEEFGRQAFLATKRFAAFTLVTTGIFALTNAVTSGFKAFITFNKELVRLQQVTGKGSIGISSLEKEITRLATSLGVSSESLTTVATTLAQAGLSAEDTRIALAALAKTELAPSFDDLVSTTEGAIAALRQFGLQTKDLEAALGSINAVAAAFAVESGDIITAIQRTGGVFASASKGVSEGKDALNEFIAVFTSVRATTRESAETIATGLRTIFTRIQRAKTIEQLKQFGVELQDLEGKFVGPFEAVRRLSEALNQLDPRDVRFSTIVEELGGFRQIGKVIPLIQQFATAQQALAVAQRGQNSLTDAQVIAQQSLANQIAKVREQFLALIRDIGKSTVFQGLFKVVLGLASGLISLASAFKPILPILAIFGAMKGVSALTQFAGGFLGGFKKSGGAKGAGENIGASISGAKEKERAEVTSRAADAIRLNTDAIKSLTTAVQSLDSTIKSRGSTTLAGGGKVYGFQSGGIVPGSGRGDKIPALLEPGEVVMNRNAVNKYGAGNLVEMNKSRSTKGIARGARSRFKELSSEELSQLSTEDMIRYAKAQARDVFTTGGAGMATSSKFVTVPQERITPELESSLTTYLGQRGFWQEVVSPFGRPNPSIAKTQSKLSREQALEQQTARMADEVAARGQQWTNIKSGSAIDNYLLGALKDPILSDYRTVRGGGSLPKAFHNTRLRKAVNEALDSYDDFDYSSGNIDKLVSNFAAQRFANGGFVRFYQKAGVVDPLDIREQLIARIQGLKGPSTAGNLAFKALDEYQRRAYGVAYPKQIQNLFKVNAIRSASGSGLIKVKDLVTKAEQFQSGIIESKEAKQKQISDNIKAGNFWEFAVAGLQYGGNFPKISTEVTPETQQTIRLYSGALKPKIAKKFERKVFQDFRNSIAGVSTSLAGSIKAQPDLSKLDFAITNAGFYNVVGAALESAVGLLTGNPYIQKTEENKSIDFPTGLGNAATLFNLPNNIPTDATRTLGGNGKTSGDMLGQIDRFLKNYKKISAQKLKLGGQLYDFAAGGTVPAMVSAGEAFIPPETAKKIGYGKLNRMNHADKNGMKGFSGGGNISVFKGPGSGTSDSIGPIGLPEGSFVIRAKATKALGLNKGGYVGLAGGGFPELTPEMAAIVQKIQKSTTKKYSGQYKAAPSMTLAGSNDLNKEQVKLVAQAEYETAAMKAIVESMDLTKDQRDQINKLQQDITNKYKDEYKSATDAADKAAVKAKAQIEFTTSARENMFGSAKPTVAKPETLPAINSKIAEERQQYLQMRAERAGMSVGGYKYSMAQKLGENQFNVRREMTLAREDTKSMAVGRARELKGVNVSDALKEGNTSAEAQRVQSVIADFTSQLQKADPSLGAEEARQAAIELAVGLSTGTKSVQEIVAANQTLNKTLNGTIDEAKVMEETFRRTSVEMGESVENLKANVSSKQLQQQAFIKSTEGQRFGMLAEFAPGLTQRFAGSKAGQAFGAGADFISGKGGRLSKAFAGAGGFAGIGAGIAGGAEALKQFLPKSATSDPNTAGALGALGGAGTGAAVGAQLGSFAGPIGTLIGGVGGAIIGGIQGFFNAKNQAILTNALENIAKKSGDLEIAFKKLENDFTSSNLENAQKQFGEVLGAQEDIRKMAFSSSTLTGNDAMGVGGMALAGAGTGAAMGALIGSVVPIIGTAVGAAIGGAVGGLGGAAYGYFNRPSEAQRTEALGSTIQQAGANQDTASRLAESQLKMMSTEDIDKTFKDSNPIVEQYKKSMQGATAAQAEEAAAIDAYMKLRKQSGATDEQISKELETNRKQAIATGKEYNNAQADALKKQTLLARATKEVAIATENLLDVYRRVDAYAQKYSSQLDRFGEELDATIAGLSGGTGMRSVNRNNEQVLTNLSAYTPEEVAAAAGATAGMLGGTKEANELASTASAAKILQDQLPTLLRNATTIEGRDDALAQIKDLFAAQGLEGGAIDAILGEIEKKITEGEQSDTGTLLSELDPVLKEFSNTAQKGADSLANLAKKYNDTLQKAIDFQQKYNAAILESNNYLRKANEIRLNAELDLAKALGKTLSLDQLNQPFDAEISSLTSGLVSTGDLAPGSVGDPASIANAIIAANQRNEALNAQSPQILTAGAGLAENDPLRNELNQAQMDNIRAMGENTVAIAEGRQALEKLANDGSKAANALSKIQEQQQKIESMAGRFEKIFTASPEELFDMNRKSDALALAQTAGADQFKSRRFRQDAFAGLEQDKEFLTNEEYNKQRAMLLRKSLESQGYTGNSMINKGGVNMTVDEFLKRVESGPQEDDPNVKAYREAVATQVAAQEALSKLSLEQAYTIQEAMLGLEEFLSTKFPDILTQAVTDSRADSETKPKTETKPKEPSQTQKDLAEARQSAKDKKAAEDKAKDKAKQAKETASGPAEMMEAKRLENEARARTREREAADATVASLESKNKTEQEAAKVEADKTAQEQAKKAENEKAARQAERRKNATDIVRRNEELRQNRANVDSTVEQRFGSVRATPTAPSTTTATASSQPKPTVSPSKETSLPTTQIPSLSRSEKANLAALARIPKEERTPDQQARYTALANRNAATNPAIQAKQKAEAIKNQQQIAQAQAANFATPVQFNNQALTLGQVDAGAATPAQMQTIARAQIGANQPQATPEQRQAAAAALANAQNPNPFPSPVPITRPQNVAYTSQVSSSPTGQTKPSSEMSANVITLDQASLDGLNSFNTNFASYVDKLVNFSFPIIPDKIEMVGNHTVDVRITGAAAFEGLDKRFKEMINKAVDEKMGNIWRQTGGAIGSNPGRPTK